MEGRKRERQRIREKIEEKLEKKMNVVKSDFNSTREEGMVDILTELRDELESESNHTDSAEEVNPANE
jgi:non-homologous end joining protein Ku